MREHRIIGRGRPRRGAAAVELAMLFPVLFIIMLGAGDFAQVFYYSGVITNCARNGALYYAGNSAATSSQIQTAALQDAGSLSATVSSGSGSDANGTYVTVTVTYKVTLYCQYLGITDPFTLTRTVQMRALPGS